MGSSAKRKKRDEEMEPSAAVIKTYKEATYKHLHLEKYKVRNGNGDFKCCFCPTSYNISDYTSLLQHAIRVAEAEVPASWQLRAMHSSMAKYLALDLANHPQQKEEETRCKMEEMRDEMNALIVKERSSNDDLQAVRKTLIKGLSDGHRGTYFPIGIKRIGELDPDVFIDNVKPWVLFSKDKVMNGVKVCSWWQQKIKDPHWYPFQIIEDSKGKPQRVAKWDDATLQALRKEWGREVHDEVVAAMNDLQENNPSGCYIVPELWNFEENRKATLDEVVQQILEAIAKGKAKPPCSANEASSLSEDKPPTRESMLIYD